MHIQITGIFIGNNIPENNSEAPLLGLAKSIYYLVTIIMNICKSLHYESVPFKKQHDDKEYY